MNKKTTILIPVFNDQESLNKLLSELENLFTTTVLSSLHILIVDDSSATPIKLKSATPYLITILSLKMKLGHQKAIATGLAYIHHHITCTHILIMDADGEDRPEDLKKLLEAAVIHPNKIVLAHRTKRQENLLYKTFYLIYKLSFRLLTGEKISFGHFMVLPKMIADKLVFYSEIWNNLPATVLKSKFEYLKIDTQKGTRYEGKSKMNFNALLLHGLGAISVFIENVAVRLLTFSILLIAFSLFIITIILGVKFFTDLAIPGWASTIMSSLLIVLLQSILLSLFTLFLFLSSQSNRKFIPALHYEDYIGNIENANHG